jgi:hypothetical protein
MPRRYWFGSAVVLAFVAVPALAADAVKLEMKFKEGDKFYIETVSNTKQDLEFMGAKIKSEIDSTQVSSFKVLKSDKDEVVIEQKIESIKTKTSGGLPGTDSDKLTDAMKGATFKVTLNNKGEVTKIEGYDEFVKKLSADNEVAGKMIKAFMNEETIKSTAAENFAFLPPKPVSKGDTWKRSQVVPLVALGSLKGETTYTYKGPGKDGEEIAYDQTMEYAPPKEGDDSLPFKITKGEMKAEKASGTMVFDASKGRLVKTDLTMKMKGSMTFDVAGNTTTLTMDMTQTSKSRILDKIPLD